MNATSKLAGYAATIGSGILALLLTSSRLHAAADDETSSQTNSNQLNQLLISDVFETTPNKNLAGEGYATGEFRFLKFPGDPRQYQFALKGEYGITNLLAAGGWIPVYHAKIEEGDSHTGIGDITLFAQYKLDQLVNPQTVNLTAQLDIVLPTGNRSKFRDTGKFGVRPLIEAYKDFGPVVGPGNFGAYALLGTTITTDPDLRIGLAGTYQWEHVTGILEFDDLTGENRGRPFLTITPGLSFRGLQPWEMTVGIPVGLNNGSPDWGVVLKFTWALQK